MKRKTALQALMILVIFAISWWFYLEYFNSNSKVTKKIVAVEKIDTKINGSSTYINDINYISSDTKGNKYQITAKKAEIKIENSDVMFLENVIAYIYMKDSDTLKITSNFGKYNSKNYDTIFSENVMIDYPDHKITGEYLDFSFLNNLGTISTNVIYTSNDTNLLADKVEMNLVNKDIKIFMNDDTKKVLLEVNK